MQVIEGDITLRNLASLTSLNGLGSLVSTNGELLLHNLPRLASTRALTNFTAVGEGNAAETQPGLFCRKFTVHSAACYGRMQSDHDMISIPSKMVTGPTCN
jgi:hypothetical protein